MSNRLLLVNTFIWILTFGYLWIEPIPLWSTLGFVWPSRVLDASIHHREWLSVSVNVMMCHRLVDTKRYPEHHKRYHISSFSSSWVVDIKSVQLFNQRIGVYSMYRKLSRSKSNVCWLQRRIDQPNS